jgi:hypothetical protein
VLAVATIAAIVSFDHIETVALANGYTLATARLLPFSVDGMILASSMALMTGTRTALARTGLVLGILATVAANVAYGAHYGLTGAVLSAWPSVAFLVSSELLVGMVRARPATAPETVAGTVAQDVTPVNVPEIAVQAVADPVTIPSAPAAAPTVASVPGIVDVPGAAPRHQAVSTVTTTSAIYPARARRAQAVAPRRAPVGKAKPPERVFAAELAAGQLPSLRAVKSAMHVGTPRARVILAELSELTDVPRAA